MVWAWFVVPSPLVHVLSRPSCSDTCCLSIVSHRSDQLLTSGHVTTLPATPPGRVEKLVDPGDSSATRQSEQVAQEGAEIVRFSADAGPLRHVGAPTKNHLQMDDHHAGGNRLYVLVKIVLPALTAWCERCLKCTAASLVHAEAQRLVLEARETGLLLSVASKNPPWHVSFSRAKRVAPPKQFFLSVGGLPESEGVRTVGRLHPDSRGATAETTPEISASAGSGGECDAMARLVRISAQQPERVALELWGLVGVLRRNRRPASSKHERWRRLRDPHWKAWTEYAIAGRSPSKPAATDAPTACPAQWSVPRVDARAKEPFRRGRYSRSKTAFQTLEHFRPFFALHRSRSCDQHCGHWRRASDRGKQSFAGFGRSWSDPDKGSLATVGEGSGSDRNKRSLEMSALHAHKSEMAFAGSGSSPPRPASHSKRVARETSTVPFSLRCLNHFTDGLSSSDSEQAPNSSCAGSPRALGQLFTVSEF